MNEALAIDRIVRSRRKTVALLVTPEGRLEIRAPQRLPREAALDTLMYDV